MNYLVPARKGSERLPGKNTRPLLGRPLIEWTFMAVRDVLVSSLDHVIVSSDDPAILDLARRWGFLARERPAGLATAEATMSDVIRHHVADFDDQDDVCVLYPTSPLRRAEHIAEAIALWSTKGDNGSTLMSVTPVLHRPYGLLRRVGDHMVPNRPDVWDKYYRAQGQPVDYRANGAIYILPVALVRGDLINTQLFGPQTLGYVMDETSGWEVDTENDFLVAASLMRHRLERVGVAAA